MRNAQKTFISVLLLFALSLSASAAVTWTTATDAGYYDIDGEKHGLIRYLFHAETDGEVTESGIKFVTSETDDTQIGEILKGKPSKSFYGSIINIPEAFSGRFFARGFVVVDGITHWSEPIGCKPDFAKVFTAPVEESEKEKIGYIISSKKLYNPITNRYYVQLTLVDENGTSVKVSVDDITDFDGEPLLGENADVGEPDEWYYYFAKYKTNTSGRINQMEIVSFYRDIDTKFSTEEGFYLVNALSLRNNFLSFYDTDSDVIIADEAALSYKCAEDCAVIRLDDNTYAGEELIRVPDNEDELYARDGGNSVIYVNSDGEIGKIYSFTENYIV